MRQFDWEPKRPPEGYFQILRGQKRDAIEREWKLYKDEKSLHRNRAQWGINAARKAEFVSEVMASLPPMPETTPPAPILTSEILKQEVQERKAAREAAKSGAEERRAALLEQARDLVAHKELKRQATLDHLHSLQCDKDSPEVQEQIRLQNARELVAAWDSQRRVKDETQRLQQATLQVPSECNHKKKDLDACDEGKTESKGRAGLKLLESDHHGSRGSCP